MRRFNVIGVFLAFALSSAFSSGTAESEYPQMAEKGALSRISIEHSLDDLTGNPVRMIIGEAAFGKPGELTPFGFMQEGYGCDNYTALKKIIKADGFNSFAFIVTGTTGNAGEMAWEVETEGWTQMPGSDYPLHLQAAQDAGMTPVAEFLIAGMANNHLALEYPDWRAINLKGELAHYMGDQLTWNSPYWDEYLLPVYREFMNKFGDQTAGLILWEFRLDQGSHWDLDTFKESGYEDWIEWSVNNQIEKWTELNETLRSTGWEGKVIGGGFGNYEYEEHVFDGSVDLLNSYWTVTEPFNRGLIQIMMPELLVHANFGAGPQRREDLHYVYRSLMYERSLFGDSMIPNFELYWQRVMTPDEVMRWLLECYSAGYPSYSVVNMEKLYLERYDPKQVESRSILRKLFTSLNELPYFGKPVNNFQFMVSSKLERSLRTPPTAGWVKQDESWVKDFWRDGSRCGVETKAKGKKYLSEYHVKVGPMAEMQEAQEVAPVFILNVTANDYEMRFHFIDEASGACSLWANVPQGDDDFAFKVGEFKLSGGGEFNIVSVSLPKEAFKKAEDAEKMPGKQVAFCLRDKDGGYLTTSLKIDKIELWSDGVKTANIELENRGQAEWYVREVSNLFKEVDRVLCGGAMISDKLTNVDDSELYGIDDKSVQIAIVPEGSAPPPPVGKKSIQYLTVKSEETLAQYRDRVIEMVKPGLSFHVGDKDPLVYANMNERDDGRQFLTVLNHSPQPGSIEIAINWKQLHEIIDSGIIGKNVTFTQKRNTLFINLDGYGGIVLSNQKDQ